MSRYRYSKTVGVVVQYANAPARTYSYRVLEGTRAYQNMVRAAWMRFPDATEITFQDVHGPVYDPPTSSAGSRWADL